MNRQFEDSYTFANNVGLNEEQGQAKEGVEATTPRWCLKVGQEGQKWDRNAKLSDTGGGQADPTLPHDCYCYTTLPVIQTQAFTKNYRQ